MAEPVFSALGRLVTDTETFTRTWPREPTLWRSEGKFTDLLSLAALDEMLSGQALRRPAFRMVADGEVLAEPDYSRASLLYPDVPDTGRMADLLERGATLVMQGLQEYWRPLGDFCRTLARDLGHPVHANGYLTPPKAQGFHLHYDVQDVFILQIEGEKDWVLHEPVVEAPLPHESWERIRSGSGRAELVAPGTPAWGELTLRPGDSLWLPRGWIHAARTREVTSLHITITLYTLTRYWAFTELAARAGRASALKEALPAAFTADADAALAELAEIRAEAVAWLQETDLTDIAAAIRSSALAMFAPPARQPVTAVLADPDYLTAEFRVRSEGVLGIDLHGDAAVLRMPGRDVRVPARIEPGLRQLLASRRCRAADLTWLADDPSRAAVLRRLHREGVIEPVTNEHGNSEKD
ncbi:hypothetical protein GCM10012275_35020 [Longimycelium tulufanense]|uniref:JmjC domain-containing protein n=1 Tax=Longimycelium tulufanense TaxID=907463 RepID=A0A8J3CFJ1_9PSEU|nr:cupin domain-containing protein [Longimycelium tulufanense]GGM60968.1 hypothetical protein GCM10012275_35020 [Longimycelium tulufanense]